MKKIISCIFFCTCMLNAQWSVDPRPVCTADNFQLNPVAVSDGEGGVIIAWEDYRNSSSTGSDIYAQRIDAQGRFRWEKNGFRICTAITNQKYPTMTTDNEGGAIIAWYDWRHGTAEWDTCEVYAQRIDANGEIRWLTNGVRVSFEFQGVALGPWISFDGSPQIVDDRIGGALVLWETVELPYLKTQSTKVMTPYYYYHIRRINSSGVLQWANSIVNSAGPYGGYNQVVSNPIGKMVIAGQRADGMGNPSVYLKQVDTSGIVNEFFPADYSENPKVACDGLGASIFIWNTIGFLWVPPTYKYAQLFNSSGIAQWNEGGVLVDTVGGSHHVISDCNGGAFITWGNIAQHYNASGVPQWSGKGIEVVGDGDMLNDRNGGAIIISQNGTQRFDASGSILWTLNKGWSNPAIVSDSAGGAIIVWSENTNIYAQRIYSDGHLGVTEHQIISINDIPNDQGGKVRIKWNKSILDTLSVVPQITSYGLWRKIPPELLAKRMMKVATNPLNDTLGTIYDFITSVPAVQSPEYNVVAPTLDDSSMHGSHYFTFLITAHTNDPNEFYISLADSGYSVDNLTPSTVTGLNAIVQENQSVKLNWIKNEIDPDVGGYVVYRSIISDFTPNPSLKIGIATKGEFIDSSPIQGHINYYRITTVDIHGNESVPSPEAGVVVNITLSLDVKGQWNMVSLPLKVIDGRKITLYPSAVSDAFIYSGSYEPRDTLVPGHGYWLKFSMDDTLNINGFPISQDTINVVTGWNIIGSLYPTISVNSIESIPSSIITSSFFGYEGGVYTEVDSIKFSRGYWIKVKSDGKIILK